MTKRADIMTALKAALVAAFQGATVTYWRDRPPLRADTPVAVTFRDVGGSFQKTGMDHEHKVRVEIEVLTFGNGELGQAMGEQLDKLIQAIGADPTLGQQRTYCELVAFAFDTAGDGFESGMAQLVIDVTYRTKAWAGV